MKQKFDNAGVDTKQNEILAMPSSARQTVCDRMRISLFSTLHEHFALHDNQISQLLNMPLSLRERLGDRIARTWESGNKVFFDKQTTDSDDLPDIKEVEIIGIDDEPEEPEYPDNPDQQARVVPLMVRIRYRYRD